MLWAESKKESISNWKAKRSNNFEQKKKGFVLNRSFRNNNTWNFPNKNFQGNKGNSQLNPNGPRNKEPINNHSITPRIMNKKNQ